MIEQVDNLNIQTIWTTVEYTLSSYIHYTLYKIKHMLDQKTILTKFQSIEILHYLLWQQWN